MATLAEFEEAIYASDITLDKNELSCILETYAEKTGEKWHGHEETICECSECLESR